jgi:hypothetical protein
MCCTRHAALQRTDRIVSSASERRLDCGWQMLQSRCCSVAGLVWRRRWLGAVESSQVKSSRSRRHKKTVVHTYLLSFCALSSRSASSSFLSFRKGSSLRTWYSFIEHPTRPRKGNRSRNTRLTASDVHGTERTVCINSLSLSMLCNSQLSAFSPARANLH